MKQMMEKSLKNNIELLAPAGTYDAFLAAIENGADAVYLGGKQLNARQFADNFDDEELERALDYAHLRGARILLTMNTLVLDNEMQEALEYAGRAFDMGVDSFIIQDLGFANNLKKAIPDISIHASTQMTVYSSEGIRTLETMGFDRAVLARELSLTEIRNICSSTELEIEVFVHGALCICYSGQCLMSSIIGGRSGNRGRCAQPCRLPYDIHRDNKKVNSGYLMSPKDLCYIDQLSDLIDAGVTSFKIEGRMKSAEYVASVVSIYRKYLDLVKETNKKADISEKDMHGLLQSFNRGGFSKGYLMGKTGPEMMAYEKPKNWGTYLGTILAQDRSTNSVKIKLDNDLGNGDGIEIWSKDKFKESPGGIITKIVRDGQLVKRAQPGDIVWVSVIKGFVEKGNKVYKTSDKEMLEQAAASYIKSNRKVDIIAQFKMKEGEKPVLSLQDDSGNSVTAYGEQYPEKAVNKPLSEERIREQIRKMGNTPFNVAISTVEMDENLILPISELNNIRRQAAERLEKERILSRKRKNNSGKDEIYKTLLNFPGNSQPKKNNVKISTLFYDITDNLNLGKVNADRLYIPFTDMLKEKVEKATIGLKDHGREIYAYIPATIKGKYTEILETNIERISSIVDGFLVGNIGTIEHIKEKLGAKTKNIIGDYTLNITNSSSLNTFKEIGYAGAAISYELNISQIEAMKFPNDFNTELGIYGKIPAMTSEYCPVGSGAGNNTPEQCNFECKKGVYHLKDRKGADFLIKSDCLDCRSTIYNSNSLFAPDLINKICCTGIQYLRLSFIDESPEEIYDIVNLHKSLIEGKKMPGQDDIIERIKTKGFTKGHLQKGV